MDGGEGEPNSARKLVTQGEWAGWTVYGEEPFEDLAGPFYYRRDDQGGIVCAFRAEKKHMNGGDFMHGGCLLTFADYSLFCIGMDALGGGGSVTASLNGEFLDAAMAGEMIEATGEVTRAGGSLVFIRGLIKANGRPVLNFSAIVKKRRRRPAEAAPTPTT